MLMGDPADPNHVPDMIIVGSTDRYGTQAASSQDADWMTTHAPGAGAPIAGEKDRNNPNDFELGYGTSYGKHITRQYISDKSHIQAERLILHELV